MLKDKCCTILGLVLTACLFNTFLHAQNCTADYFSINYQTPSVEQVNQTTFTREDNICIAGTVLKPHSVLVNAMLTKTTKQGTILWSRAYSSANYDYVQFYNVVALDDGSSMVSGSLATVDTSVAPPAVLASTGFLAKIDKYGAIVWTRLFDNIFSPGRMILLKNGNIITTLTGYKDVANTLVLCFDTDGNIVWSNTLKWRNGDNPSDATIKEIDDGSVIMAQKVNVFSFTDPSITPKNGYYAISINPVSGLKQWDKFYWYNIGQPNDRATFGEVVSISQFSNGNISLITSMADTAYYQFRKTTAVTNIITDKKGNLLSVSKYTSDKPPIYASGAAYLSSKDQLAILMDNADAPQILCINQDGDIAWQRAYAKVGRSQETTSILGADDGFYFFCFTHNGGSTEFSLTKTDIQGGAECVETSLNIYKSDVSNAYTTENGELPLEQKTSKWYPATTISKYDYKIQSTVICKQTCCVDVTTTAPDTDLCNAENYTLPNNDVVTTSGIYALTYKTAKGCDSLVYYKINFSKSPEVELGYSNCLDGKDSLVLKANPIYENYVWNGVQTNNPYYTVTKPGDYVVSITNACGTKKDTIKIFQPCEFTISMPNAFTPNGDGNNDIYRIPKQVNNRLIRFIIYNRWGQLVYSSSDINSGWNGNYNNNPAPAGTYVYIVEMEPLNGNKKLKQQGWVMLLR